MNKFSMISLHRMLHIQKFAYISRMNWVPWWDFQKWLCELADTHSSETITNRDFCTLKITQEQKVIRRSSTQHRDGYCYREMKMNFWAAFQVYPNNFSASFGRDSLSNLISSFKSARRELGIPSAWFSWKTMEQ